MSIDKDNDENIPAQTDAYYEELACQEEVYLEETEEELRMILISDDPSLSGREVERPMSNANNDFCRAESLDV